MEAYVAEAMAWPIPVLINMFAALNGSQFLFLFNTLAEERETETETERERCIYVFLPVQGKFVLRLILGIGYGIIL